VLVGGTLTPDGADAATARSELYSTAAVNGFCLQAQYRIASMSGPVVPVNVPANVPTNVVHTTINALTYSSAAPYEGESLGGYHHKSLGPNAGGANGALDLPLTTQSFVYYGETTTGLQVPLSISCKMKSAEAVQFHFGPTAAGAQMACRDINQDTLNRVFSTLTAWEKRYLRFNENQVVLDSDPVRTSGPHWMIPLIGPTPLNPTVAYIGNDGLLHLQAARQEVLRGDTRTTPDKAGSFYCHFVAPEYLRLLVTGGISPVTHQYSPTY
jgi:hypothetical protein